MANEHTLIVEYSSPIGFTCANGTGIEKGAVLQMTDPMTASAASAISQFPAGIAATEKIASDGKTKIAVYRDGIFKGTCSGAIAIGDPIGTDVSNLISKALTVSGCNVLGIALETGANTETILYELRPFGMLGMI